MKCLKDPKKEFKAGSGECWKCDKIIDCLMRLYDEPLPSIIIYSSDLTKP